MSHKFQLYCLLVTNKTIKEVSSLLLFCWVSQTKQNNMKTGSDGHMAFSSLENVSVVFQLPRKRYAVCGEPKEWMQTHCLCQAFLVTVHFKMHSKGFIMHRLKY